MTARTPSPTRRGELYRIPRRRSGVSMPATTIHWSPITMDYPGGVGRGCGVGRGLGNGVGLGVAVGVCVGVGLPPPTKLNLPMRWIQLKPVPLDGRYWFTCQKVMPSAGSMLVMV